MKDEKKGKKILQHVENFILVIVVLIVFDGLPYIKDLPNFSVVGFSVRIALLLIIGYIYDKVKSSIIKK